MAQKKRRICQRCGQFMAPTKRSTAKYCTASCQRAAAEQRRRARLSDSDVKITISEARTANESRLAATIREMGLWAKYVEGEITQATIARTLGMPNESSVRRALDQIQEQVIASRASESWVMDDEIRELLGLDDPMPDPADFEACLAWATEMADRFLRFEGLFFRTPTGKPYMRVMAHRVWIIEIMLAYATGGYLQILAPPRHGKSDLLAHFCVWMIGRNPSIRILWVSAISETAEEFLTKVRDHLEFNTTLIESVLPPGQFFVPANRRSGSDWNVRSFTVSCRPYGITGSTMIAAGRGKKILSKNADLIVGDDIEDDESTENEEMRRKTRRWFGQRLDSRKEEHTPMILIGSRQHPLDLYHYNLSDPNFRHVVHAAHRRDCPIDETLVDLHQDCMLFPQLRTFRWLMTKKYGADARDEGSNYEMVYLQMEQAVGFTVFDRSELEQCRNYSRAIGAGMPGIPRQGMRLVAGLDPSVSGFQAAVMWAAVPPTIAPSHSPDHDIPILETYFKRYMVDLENRLGGGIEPFLELGKFWLETYGLRHWVIEENNFQALYHQDSLVKSWAERYDVHIEGTETYGNKYDRVTGVAAQRRLFRDYFVDFPYGDAESIDKSNLYIDQAVGYSEEPNRRRRSDVLMAGWFPQRTIRRWEKEYAARLSEKDAQDPHVGQYPMSYPGLTQLTAWNAAPWS